MQIECPHCHGNFTPPIARMAGALGSLGGRVTGPSKARSTEQARAAGRLGAKKRWLAAKLAAKQSS